MYKEGAGALFLCERRRSGRIHARQDRAPLSWTNEGVDTFFRLRLSEEGSGCPSAILASEHSETARQHQN
jgi:hypothetical protein